MAAGCYVPRYFAASYKGVAFEAMELSTEFGRRNALGEFVFAENTGQVDLGRKLRRYSVAGRFPTNDHISRGKALVRACESVGAGTLVHPVYGSIRVACESLKVTDNPQTSIGYTTVDMTFVEAGGLTAGFSLSASIFGLDISAVLAAVQGSFLSRYSPKTARLHDIPTVIATVASSLTNIRTEYTKTLAVTQSNGTTASVAQYTTLSDMEDAINNTALLSTASTAYEALRSGFEKLSTATTGDVKYQAMRRLSNAAAAMSTLSGVGGVSQNSVYALVRNIAAARMAQAALGTSVTTLDAALTQYDQVVTVLDGEADLARTACDEALFLALRLFTTEVKTLLLNRAYKLPALIGYNFGGTVHSLVAAYEIFGDAKRFGEIESRNANALPFQVGPVIIGAAA